MADDKAFKEGLQLLEDELAKMAGHMQSAYQSATTAVDICGQLSGMLNVCDHTEPMRTGYYKSDKPGMVRFWCKGCQSEQEIVDPSDEGES